MKKILLIALSGIMLVPSVIKTGEDLSQSAAGAAGDILSKISCPIPEKYRVPLTATSLAVLGCYGLYQQSQKATLAQELAKLEKEAAIRAELEKQEAFAKRVAQVKNELKPLIIWPFFRTTNNGIGFDGWFKQQQEYILAIINNQELLKQALDPYGALAIRDRASAYGVYLQKEGYNNYIYTFSIDTPKSVKAAQAYLKKEQPETQIMLIASSSNAIPDIPLVLKIEKGIVGQKPEVFGEDLLFTPNLTSPENPYNIRIYEEVAPVAVPKPGWFAGWFTSNKTTPTPAAEVNTPSAPASTTGPTGSSAGAPGSSSTSTPTATPSSSSGVTISNISISAPIPSTPAPTKRFWEFWK